MAQLNSLIVTGDSRFLNTINGDISGTSSNVTGTVAIANGGTGGTTAATARSNLGVPAMTTQQYPALLPTDGNNNWIKVGTSNTNYGLLPSQVGNAGSGHNYLGTSSWYWKYAYIDEIHGTLKGNADSASSVPWSGVTDKPTIPAAQVNSDWNATSGVAKILNKPTIPAAQVNSDWNASSGVAQILNKPTTLSGYGITDAKITSGTITLGSNTITPLTSSSSLNAAKLTGTVPASCYTDTWTAMVGATSSANGSVGYVNAVPPKDGYNTKYLRADGSWAVPAYPTVNNATFKVQLGGTDKKSFTANASTDVTANFVFTAGTTPSTVTKKTVVTSASGATAAYANGILTITDGSFDSGDSVTVTAGTAPSLAIN